MSGIEQTCLPVFTSACGQAKVMDAYDRVMAAWPVAYDEAGVRTSFGETHVIVSGPPGGRPLVLLHALMATATSWYRVVGSLASEHRVYAVDGLGEPGKSRPARSMATLDDFLAWFTELLGGLGIETFDLVGNSFGGFTAAYYAMALPERIRKLVLIAPAATIHRIPAFYVHVLAPKALYGFFPWLPGQPRAMRRTIRWMANGLPGDPLWVPLFYRTMLYGSLTNRLFPRVYAPDEFARIRADTLVIIGARERIYPPQNAIGSARRLIPRCEVALIPEAHHIVALAQPVAASQRILEFIDRGSR